MHFFTVKPGLRVETVEAPLVAQCRACLARQLIDQPEAGIVAYSAPGLPSPTISLIMIA
jgi:hypothetical protein